MDEVVEGRRFEDAPMFCVDAFADGPFRGNPAAVCLLAEERDPEWMQSLAAEMNLSETAFVRVPPARATARAGPGTGARAGAGVDRGAGEVAGAGAGAGPGSGARAGDGEGRGGNERSAAGGATSPVRGSVSDSGASASAASEPAPAEEAPIGLRWFTPKVEVALCGHATLASAHVLWESGRLGAGEPAWFSTRSGLLAARRREDGWIELDFPSRDPVPAEPPEGLIEALGVQPAGVHRSGEGDYLVELFDAEAVRAVEPDFALLGSLEARGVIVTARADEDGHDVVSRFFAPAVGVPEDPVTGSAHCTLGPYWARRLGRERLRAYQASARGGVVEVTVRGDRVGLAGRAVTVWEGRLRV
ncbi:MAG TPA: PhzF family phenazine biosynthesis protein [Thermoanaerobaculia bacterium]|nr:PhzF family phenazine biosynthesis protein [Thermoanaerobaculia bacterium]